MTTSCASGRVAVALDTTVRTHYYRFRIAGAHGSIGIKVQRVFPLGKSNEVPLGASAQQTMSRATHSFAIHSTWA